MSKLNSIIYALKEGFTGILKNLMMSFISFSMLIGSLLVVGSLMLIVVNIDSIIDSIGDRNEIVIYINEDYGEEDINRISEELMSFDHVVEMNFISRETALESMKDELEEYSAILEGMEEDNPLRDSFNIKVDEPENAEAVADKLEDIEGVEKVRARIDIITSFLNVRNTVNAICIGLMILLGAVSLFIIMNTIRMSAYTRREEIAIMRMVGATKGMIRFSFLVEGVVISLLGSVCAYGLIDLIYKTLFAQALANSGFLTAVPFSTINVELLLIFLGAGVFMGACGSLFSINKYLKV